MKFPPAPAHQAKSAHNSVQQLEASKTSDLDSVTTKKRKRSESANGISESSQDKQPDEDIPSAVATNTALVDDDIDWTAISVVPDSQLVSSTDDMQAGASQLSTDGPDTGLAHSQQAEAACTNEGLQQQQGALVTHKVPSRGDDAGDKQVQHAVGEYVKALLDPFYKAGIVDREVG